jgi:hypothetical protein
LSATSASFADTAGTANTATSASYAFTASSAVNATNALTASSLTALNQTVTITGSVNVSGSIRISQGDDLITHHVQAAGSNGLELQNNGGNVVVLLGAGGGLGTTFNGQVNATAFSGSGALVYGVVSSSYAYTASSAVISLSSSYSDNSNTANSATSATSASYAYTASSAISSSFALTASYLAGAVSAFPFTGSAGITGSLDVIGRLYVPSGSLEITGSATINSGSLVMFSYKAIPASNRSFEAMVTQSLNSTNNIISATINSANTGSIVISGSGNYVSLASVAINTQNQQGLTSGFSGTNAYVTLLPGTTGSNPNFNTTADRNNRRVPQITNSNVNATITVNDNRASESSTPFTLNQSSNNMTTTVTVQSGSLQVSNSQLIGTGTTFLVSGSGTLAANATINNSILSTQSATIIAFYATSSGAATLNNSILVGANLRVNITGSSSQNSTTTTTPAINDSVIIGRHLVVTGSSASGTQTANIAVFGAHNTADGLLNDGRFTKFAIGTGVADATRRTSFHVSASGMTTIVNSAIVSGSLVGNAISQSVSSNTASLNLTTGNFFNLTLPASTNTYITASGQVDGQTVNIKVTQGATVGTLSFGNGFKQASGNSYTGSQSPNAVDIVTLISFDNTGIYVSNVNNLV